MTIIIRALMVVLSFISTVYLNEGRDSVSLSLRNYLAPKMNSEFGRFSPAGSEEYDKAQTKAVNEELQRALNTVGEGQRKAAIQKALALAAKVGEGFYGREHINNDLLLEAERSVGDDGLDDRQRKVLTSIHQIQTKRGGAFDRFSPAGIEFIIQKPVVDSAL